jgi:predicted transposase
MKMVIQLQMLPTPVQAEKLLETIRLVNGAATFAAQCGFSAGAFTQANIHRLAYFAIREKFSLPAQLAVRAI